MSEVIVGFLTSTAMQGLIAAAISAGAVLLFQKMGFDVSKSKAAKLKDEILDVVIAVEEIAASRKETEPMSSKEKLAEAVSKVKFKFPKVPASVIADGIHAILGRANLGALSKSVRFPKAG